MKVYLGRWSREHLGRLIDESSKITLAGERVAFLSGHFLHTLYEESTLTGDMSHDEEFVINLAGVDCLTFLEHIEALRLSSSFGEFEERLRGVRYRDGKVSFRSRNHFFTDWRESRSGFVLDVTEEAGGDRAREVLKMLNSKEDGTLFVQGIEPAQRKLAYIPAGALDNSILDRMESGDYAGVYSEKSGLDVSHVGIIVKHGKAVILRHASSDPGRREVVDEDFQQYLSGKPGLILLRPRNV
jgi:hypothetical protein